MKKVVVHWVKFIPKQMTVQEMNITKLVDTYAVNEQSRNNSFHLFWSPPRNNCPLFSSVTLTEKPQTAHLLLISRPCTLGQHFQAHNKAVVLTSKTAKLFSALKQQLLQLFMEPLKVNKASYYNRHKNSHNTDSYFRIYRHKILYECSFL